MISRPACGSYKAERLAESAGSYLDQKCDLAERSPKFGSPVGRRSKLETRSALTDHGAHGYYGQQSGKAFDEISAAGPDLNAEKSFKKYRQKGGRTLMARREPGKRSELLCQLSAFPYGPERVGNRRISDTSLTGRAARSQRDSSNFSARSRNFGFRIETPYIVINKFSKPTIISNRLRRRSLWISAEASESFLFPRKKSE